MNRTIKEATVKVFHYPDLESRMATSAIEVLNRTFSLA